MTGRPRTVSGRAADQGRAPTTPLAPTVLLADADADAQAMMRDALLEGTGPCQLRTVGSAEELESYLRDPNPANPKPALVLIDLHEDGLDALTRIKRDADLRHIPVVVLASAANDDTATAAAYEAGANTVIPKPATFIELVRLVKVLTAYWLEAAALPPQQDLP
ncbi:MAG TPA: response regulator [Solirubrobacteraceae bacterium]|nr:response regulator [Solirubrobacteraceae bacterium]